MAASNSYSAQWFEFFHTAIAEQRTAREIEFICGWAPLPPFRKVLDICCGMGRHARALAQRGYSIVGVERDSDAVAKARQLAGGPEYIESDIRDFEPEKSAYDVAVVMSQSFGYFDATTNRDVLKQLMNSLRPGGRIILDLWNPEFFAANRSARDLATPSGIVRENRHIHNGRLRVELTYPDGAKEDFEWQLYTPAEIRSVAESVGATLVGSCTDFNAQRKPNRESPRIQFVLEKVAVTQQAKPARPGLQSRK